MRTVAVFNQKGGCGKTTTAIHLAACLAEAGKKTLIVDLDPQGHATLGTNVQTHDIENSTFDCLVERQDGCKMLLLSDIAWEIMENLYLAPSSIMLSAIEQRLAGLDGREQRLREALAKVEHIYDFTIIDCGPSMNLLAVNAVLAADTVLIPVETGYFCLKSVGPARETVELVAQRTGHQARIVIVPTMYDPRTKSDRAAYRRLQTEFADQLADTTIHFNAKLKEAAAAGSPINEFFPGCRGHKDYQALAHELMSMTLGTAMAAEIAETKAQVAETRAAIEQLAQEILGPQVTPHGVVFTTRAPGARRVQVAGSFNGWNPEAGNMYQAAEDGQTWKVQMPIPQGCHQYRYVVDGRWISDPANSSNIQNEFGETNSLVEVQA